MNRLFAALAGLALLAAPALAATCKDEVAAAFEKQRKTNSFRMVTNMVSAEGPVQMTVDYILPNKMHQTIKALTNPNPAETILVFDRAWTNEGKGWTSAPPELADQLSKEISETVLEPPSKFIDYACLGRVAVDGKEYFAYRAQEDTREKIPGAPQADPPLRLLYVDPETGLPARNVAALKGREDKPFFKTVYAYPKDIKIEPPTDAAPGPRAAKPPR